MRRRKLRAPPAEHTVLSNAHERLVDEETWQKVQARFAAHSGLAPLEASAVSGRGRAPASILSGLVRCGVCGGGFVVWTSGPNPKQRARGLTRSQRRFACGRTGPRMCRTPSPPIATGSCKPDESLTNSSAGQHIDRLRSRAAGSSGAPRHLTLCIRYGPLASAASAAGRRPRISSIASATRSPVRRRDTTTC